MIEAIEQLHLETQISKVYEQMASKKNSNGNGRKVNGAKIIPGFRKVETHLIGFWKPEIAGQAVQGIVGDAVEVVGTDGKANTFYSLTVTTNDAGPIVGKDNKKIDVGAGQMIGIGGKMLIPFLRGREGREVYLEYTGLGKKKAGQNAPKMFDTFERDAEE
jgi:hypothetical protein